MAARPWLSGRTPVLLSAGRGDVPLGRNRRAPRILTVRADVVWNPSFNGLPEISNGRITADQLDLNRPAGDAPVPVTKVRSDFSISHGVIRGDVYADLPSGGSLLAGDARLYRQRCADAGEWHVVVLMIWMRRC